MTPKEIEIEAQRNLVDSLVTACMALAENEIKVFSPSVPLELSGSECRAVLA